VDDKEFVILFWMWRHAFGWKYAKDLAGSAVLFFRVKE
jgi:hypothetical protein